MKPPLKSKYADDFQTPPLALNPLLPHLKHEWIIWECAQGRGNLTKEMERHGFSVVGTDILTGQDFLHWRPDRFDCIVTNPPYSLKERFLARAYQLGKPFALLLPLTALETRKRQAMFRRHGLELILFDRRINFGTPSGKGGGAWFATAWFTNWLNMGRGLTFVPLKDTGQIEMEIE